MLTLLVLCVLRMEDGSVQRVQGHEVVWKSTEEKLFVQFDGGSKLVSANVCNYLENPEIVSQRPELYYPKFQPELTEEEMEQWRTNGGLTVKEIISRRKK